MTEKTKTFDISFADDSGAFNTILKRFTGGKEKYDFEGLSVLRKLLSNEKARLLNVIKSKKPGSIYQLAKILGRDFKSVSNDIKHLERFGFVSMVSEKTGKRERLKPFVVVDSVHINLRL